MSTHRPPPRRWSLLDDESGQALVVALVIILVGVLLGIAAVTYALNGTHSSAHDQRVRASQQAADAGVAQQLYLQSDSAAVGYDIPGGGTLGTSAVLDCVVAPSAAGGASSLTGYVNTLGQCVPVGTSSTTKCTTSTATSATTTSLTSPLTATVATPVTTTTATTPSVTTMTLPSTTTTVPTPVTTATVATPTTTAATTTAAAASTPNCAIAWSPAGDQALFEDEFWANPTTQTNGSSVNSTLAIEFPDILSLGCHTTTPITSASPSASMTTCNNGGGDAYFRRLALLTPTAPLQALEAGNDATVSGSALLNNVATTLIPLASALNDAATVAGVQSLCSSANLVTTLTTAAATLTKLGLTLTGVESTCSQVTALSVGVAAINGNITAAHDIYLPNTVAALNTTGIGAQTSGVGGAIGAVVTSLGSVATNLANADPTFEYGDDLNGDTGDICSASYAGANPPSSTSCYPQTRSTYPVTAAGANFVQAATGACLAGAPSQDCNLQRPTFSITTAPLTSLANSGITSSGTGGVSVGATPNTAGYGVLTVTPGTVATFAAGTYVFCGVYSRGTIAASTGGVQIFVLAPGANGCQTSTASTVAGAAPPAGSFVACGGISNLLKSGDLDGVSGVVNPSGVQIYVQGDSSYQKQSADTAIGACPYTVAGGASGPSYTAPGGADPDTQVWIGNTNNATTQAFVLYAPASEVTINTTGIFEGSAIGWNVDVSATAIVQDFDLGNYPLSSAVNADQVAENEQCDDSVVPLTFTNATYDTTKPGTLIAANDLGGC